MWGGEYIGAKNAGHIAHRHDEKKSFVEEA